MGKLQPVKCGCGGEPEIMDVEWSSHEPIMKMVICSKCGTRTDLWDTEFNAVEAWNLAMGDFPKTIIQKIDSVTPVKCEYGDEKIIFASGYICPNCYSHVTEKDKYCHECGMKLDWNNYV